MTISFQQGVNGYVGTADTMLRESRPGSSYATAASVNIDGVDSEGKIRDGLLYFANLFGDGPGQIPYGATITSATLTLEVNDGTRDGLSFHRMLIDWARVSTWTWDSFGSGIQYDNTEAAAAGDLTMGTIAAGLQDLDVTQSLQAWADGASNYGWAIRTRGSDGWDFASSEGATKPKLTVTYTTGPSTPPAADINIVQSNGSTQVTEGGATDTFTVALSSAPTADVVVTINNTADVTGSPTTLTFTSANWNTPQTVTVSAVDDALVEGPETSNLTFSVSSTDARYNNFSIAPVAVSVTDNDAPPVVPPVVSIGNATAAEGSGAITFTVSLDKTADQPVTVNYATADGTAKASSDYISKSGTLTFAAGQTEQTITINLLDDALTESTEAFSVNLASPTNATLGTSTATGTITDNDDPAPLPTLSVTDPTVSEDGGNLVYTVTLSAASTSPVTVAYSTAPGTATAGTDYTTQTGTLTIPAGQTSGTISVPILNDFAVEPNETVLLNLTNPTGATIADAQGSGTITNDDQAPAPTLAVSDVTVTEGGAALVTVSLSGPATGPVSVAYGTAPGSAVAGSDYTSLTGTLNFATGETSKTVSVVTINDTVFEPTESFNFNLSSPTAATIADGTGVITITDNDSTTPPPVNPAVVAIHNTTLYKAGDPSGYGCSDPSGLAYVPGLDLIFIADSEHDESPFFSPTNLFAVRPDGTHVASYSLTSFTKEPTGLAYNPNNGYLYITDDSQKKVFWVDPENPSVKIGEFSVSALGLADAEDPKFDPVTGHMYMLNGLSNTSARNTLFELTATGDLVRSFRLPSEIKDAEALAYDSANDVFYVASGATRGTIFRMSSDGQLLDMINLLNQTTYRNEMNGGKPQIKGLELAPSSNLNDGNKLSLYAADYGTDQYSDGRLIEIDLGTGWLIT